MGAAQSSAPEQPTPTSEQQPPPTSRGRPGGGACACGGGGRVASPVRRSNAAVRGRVKRCFSLREFPMYVAPIQEVLKMERIECHEDLMKKKILVEWSRNMENVVFISHTWLGSKHPDPNSCKLNLLKELLQAMCDGNAQLHGWWTEEMIFGEQTMKEDELQQLMNGGYVWLDFWSVPQRNSKDQLAAINSIPSYVSNCSAFFCLAPPVWHEKGSLRDLRAWKRRGWCRLELLSNALSPHPKRCVIVESLSSAYIAMSRDWLFHPVGKGDFTVEADRNSMGPVIERMIDARQMAALQKDNLREYRFLESTRGLLLAGTGTPLNPPTSLDEWMKSLLFTSIDEEKAAGWTPFRFAIYGNNLQIASELLQKGADIEAPLSRAALDKGWHCRGNTILHGISLLCDAPDAIAFLMENKANPARIDEKGSTPLHLACYGGRTENIDALLKVRPEALHTRDSFGLKPWMTAVMIGQSSAVRHLLSTHQETVRCTRSRRARQPTSTFGHSVCALAVLDVGDVETLQLCIDAGHEINIPNKPQGLAPRVSLKAVQTVCKIQNEPSIFVEGCANAPNATPLFIASYLGNVGATQLLLNAKADTGLANCYGRTPLIASAMRGHASVVQLLLDADASPELRDRGGLTAADWAERRGHSNLAAVIKSKETGVAITRTRSLLPRRFVRRGARGGS
mmetsp:Transcript_28953/g.61535  ORF Transcript_28953/g.61535 Transcript_28953/m.61535 type:complete len:682 (-) Transcript_28953:72-2117(-)